MTIAIFISDDLVQQDVTFCGPEKETCVANQTRKSDECLIPCDGLYASVVDGSLRQNVMEG